MRSQGRQSVQTKEVSGEDLERYVALLRDGDNFEKEKAIDALVASGGKEVVERIVPLLQEKNTPVRMAILDVLKKIGSIHLDGVIGMLEDANEAGEEHAREDGGSGYSQEDRKHSS